MKEMISRDAVLKILNHNWGKPKGYSQSINEISELPTIEERKTGKWITNLYAFGEDRYECDQCHNTALHCYDFCPNCGAKMER